jgi:hypothetical protein
MSRSNNNSMVIAGLAAAASVSMLFYFYSQQQKQLEKKQEKSSTAASSPEKTVGSETKPKATSSSSSADKTLKSRSVEAPAAAATAATTSAAAADTSTTASDGTTTPPRSKMDAPEANDKTPKVKNTISKSDEKNLHSQIEELDKKGKVLFKNKQVRTVHVVYIGVSIHSGCYKDDFDAMAPTYRRRELSVVEVAVCMRSPLSFSLVTFSTWKLLRRLPKRSI